MDQHSFCLEPVSDISPKSFEYFTSDGDLQQKKTRALRDAQAHRLIEKRRRDRMNSCLSHLGQIIQVNNPDYRHGRVEKTEIIEMAIKHIENLQNQVNARQSTDEDRFVAGYQRCHDDAFKFLAAKSENDSPTADGMNLIAHLQDQLENLQNGTNGNALVTSTQQSSQYLNSLIANSSVHSIKPETVDSLDNNNVTDLSIGRERRARRRDTTDLMDTNDRMSQSSSSSSDLNKTDSIMESVLDYSADNCTESEGKRCGDGTQESRSNRRRSFSECGIAPPYKFKDNMKVRFRQDSTNRIHDRFDESTRSSSVKRHCVRGERHEDELVILRRSGHEIQVKQSTSSASGNADHCEYIPAFALYPGRTFYIPVSLSYNRMSSALSEHIIAELSHPISITVNFSGPRIQATGVTSRSPHGAVD